MAHMCTESSNDDPMTKTIQQQQEEAEAEFMSVQFETASETESDAGNRAEAEAQLVASFGVYEAEYAAIRKGVGIFHDPTRGLLVLRGKDVKDLLHRVTTQEINDLTGGQSVRSFQLNTKGRIIADMIVHHGDDSTWLETDKCDVDSLAKSIDAYLFGEDVAIKNITDQRELISLHGPASRQLIDALVAQPVTTPLDEEGTHHVIQFAGSESDAQNIYLTATRRDVCGSPGYHLWVPSEHAAHVYASLADACGGLVPDVDADATGGGAKREIKGRAIGWAAYNTARIEAGTPLYHVDFGPDSLPAETGLFDSAVSLTKGCYTGQEIVARMYNLGHPKRVCVGFRCGDDQLPIAGAQVMDETSETIIGAVTSSTLSPMSGNIAIGFATMKWAKHREGVKVQIPAEGQMVQAEMATLTFL